MKIFYWSPFTSKVATIKAVVNSAVVLKRKYGIKTFILNSHGEWDSYQNELKKKKIKIINVGTKIRFLSSDGYFKSRLLYAILFINSFFSLRNILKKNSPDFLVIHLITSLPIILYCLFHFKTKLILRISGYPKLNFLRKFLWKMASKKFYAVTTPTLDTYHYLKKQKIFDRQKIFYLADPVFNNKDLRKKKRKLKFKNYLLNIGRLTKQKNQRLLINSFKEILINTKNSKLKLLILGKGEEERQLKKIVKILSLEKNVFFLGHVSNPYDYIQNSKCVVISSLWEDPGFVMIETSALKKPVICSNCPNGPKEFFKKTGNKFLFQNNNQKSLVKAFKNFTNCNPKKLKETINQNYIKSLEYSDIEHAKNFLKLINKKNV